ncbi:NAD(P)-binding protein [Fistulina hepatica ATCC 64428]|nr:NAD(P)-binding protein [Fistulina hepatica ATCC 64428]
MPSLPRPKKSSNLEGYHKAPITIAVIGCGERGRAYASYALEYPRMASVVAIAEPRPNPQRSFAQLHKIDRTLVFNSWRDLWQASEDTINTVGTRLADAVIVAVQDHMHVEVTMAFAEQGYHILCEKPMATTPIDLVRMGNAIERAGVIFGMGHVMRYSPYSRQITEIIRSGELGNLVNIVQVEPVGHYHFAHSYVRGNWAKEENSSFVLLTKCCHDIDLICHWMSPATPVKVSSFGSLRHFHKKEKPTAAGDAIRCLQCPHEKNCAYSAKRIYLELVSRGYTDWPVNILVDSIPDIENITAALRSGPYGMCVYESENDVCDNQVVNMQFSNGSTVSFTMVAFSDKICEREVRLGFTHGEIVGDSIKFDKVDFANRTKKQVVPQSDGGGHGGGDKGLALAFFRAVQNNDQSCLGTDVSKVVNSHLTVFAAEKSRREGIIVDCEEYQREVREQVRLMDETKKPKTKQAL